MLWLFIIGVLLASIWLEAYLRRRRNGQADGDWTFLQNRCALAAGGVAAVLIAPNLGSPGNLGFAVPTSMLAGRHIWLRDRLFEVAICRLSP
jgi:hypothetical protein